MLLPRERLEKLRDRLRSAGNRPSMMLGSSPASLDLVEAVQIVEEYGPLCEAMYLVMAADRRVVDAERQLLRGALEILSEGRVHTYHMDAMLDDAARKSAREGSQARLDKCLDVLAEDPARAETAAVLAAAIAAADAVIVPEEHALLTTMFKRLRLEDARVRELLAEIESLTEHLR